MNNGSGHVNWIIFVVGIDLKNVVSWQFSYNTLIIINLDIDN